MEELNGGQFKFIKVRVRDFTSCHDAVTVLCSDSLVSFLSSELKGFVSRESVEEFVRISESYSVSGIGEALEISEKAKTFPKLPNAVLGNIERIDRLLRNIKICTIADNVEIVLTEMAKKLVKLRYIISLHLGSRVKYCEIKKHCVENSLYGVGFELSKIEESKRKLSFFVFGEKGNLGGISLPSLDYKIMCGNPLLEVEKKFLDEGILREIEQLKLKYSCETDSEVRKFIGEDVKKRICQVTGGCGDFDFEIYFSEVFHREMIHLDLFYVTWKTARVSKTVNSGRGDEDVEEVIVLSDQERECISRIISERIRMKGYKVVVYNVLESSVHLLVACKEEDLHRVIGDIKGYSSYMFHRYCGSSYDSGMIRERGLGVFSNTEALGNLQYVSSNGVKKIVRLWSKKYRKTRVNSESEAKEVVGYIDTLNFRYGLKQVVTDEVRSCLSSYEDVVKPYLVRGFDIVVGVLSKDELKRLLVECGAFSKGSGSFQEDEVISNFFSRISKVLSRRGVFAFLLVDG
ncbi:MAG: transposase [Brevinematia bacterium]